MVYAYRRVNLDLLWRAVERLPAIENQIARHPRPRGMSRVTKAPRGQPALAPHQRPALIAKVTDEGPTAAEDQYRLLLEAKHRPGVLDDHTVERTLPVFAREPATNAACSKNSLPGGPSRH